MNPSISALVDGELEQHEVSGTLASVLHREEAGREAWRMYHLINDAMAGSQLLSPGFAARVASRLEEEPTVLAPASAGATRTAWSHGRVRRYLYPAAASLAAVGFVGLLGFPQHEVPRSAVQVAAVAVPAKAESPVIRIPPPKAAHEYLLAHQGFSPRNALQGLAPYVRTVGDESSEQGRR